MSDSAPQQSRNFRRLVLGVSALVALGICAWIAQYFVLRNHYLEVLEPGQPIETQIEAARWLSQRRILEAVPGLVRCAAEHLPGQGYSDNIDFASDAFDKHGHNYLFANYVSEQELKKMG